MQSKTDRPQMNIFTAIGLGLNCVLLLINRLIVEIPDAIYIPLGVTACLMLLVGFFQAKREKAGKTNEVNDDERKK